MHWWVVWFDFSWILQFFYWVWRSLIISSIEFENLSKFPVLLDLKISQNLLFLDKENGHFRLSHTTLHPLKQNGPETLMHKRPSTLNLHLAISISLKPMPAIQSAAMLPPRLMCEQANFSVSPNTKVKNQAFEIATISFLQLDPVDHQFSPLPAICFWHLAPRLTHRILAQAPIASSVGTDMPRSGTLQVIIKLPTKSRIKPSSAISFPRQYAPLKLSLIQPRAESRHVTRPGWCKWGEGRSSRQNLLFYQV